MRLRMKKSEVELILAVLKERINLMRHAGVSYTDTLAYRNTYHKLEYERKKEIRRKESKKRMG